MEYRYKANSNIDAYGDTQDVIHFKFGDVRKMYHFTEEFEAKHPKFCKEFVKYWLNEQSLFSDPLSIVNYIDRFKLPVRLYSNFVDKEFADIQAAREWLGNEYQGQNSRKLYEYDLKKGCIGLDGEARND